MGLKNAAKTESWDAHLKGMGALVDQVNEAVNFELGVIFIAIPKTGTTTVRSQTKSQGNFVVPGPHLNIVQVRDSLYIHLLKQCRNRNNRFPMTNLLSDSDIRKLTVKVFKDLFKFSAVRNPWARAASLYARREGVQVSKNMTFETYIQQHTNASDTSHWPTLHRNQYDWLCDESGVLVMDFIYKVEEFDLARHTIEERTNGRIKLGSAFLNKNPDPKSNDYRALYNDSTKKLVADHFEKDIDTFKYVF